MRRLLLFFCLFAFPLAAHASETPAEHAARTSAQQELDAAPRHGNVPDYSLSPVDLAKSQHLSTIHVTLHFVDSLWGILQLLLLLWLGGIAWMRDKAVIAGGRRSLQITVLPVMYVAAVGLIDLLPILFSLPFVHKSGLVVPVLLAPVILTILILRFRAKFRKYAYLWAEGFAFLILFLVASTLLSLPLDIYSEHLSHVYGFSVQSWPSWTFDQLKSLGLAWLFGGLVVMLLFWIIRKAPNKWWLIFWLFIMPITVFGAFIGPYISYLFYKHEPLQQTNPALVAQLEKVVAKGHMDIPPERMYLMKASDKTTTLNADVEGFGSSKRVVVWDTTIAKATPDEITFIFGHESGHYVLGHIVRGMAEGFIGSLLILYLGFVFIRWSLARFGPAWRIPSQYDWGTLAVLLLALNLIGIFSEPVVSVLSRQKEHAADVYGQEAIHGLVADPQSVAKGAFDVLGQTSLADPNPNPFFEFWTYSHPAIGRRAAFAAAYNPWAPGMEPKYFKADSGK